jgi:hypothetical protein
MGRNRLGKALFFARVDSIDTFPHIWRNVICLIVLYEEPIEIILGYFLQYKILCLTKPVSIEDSVCGYCSKAICMIPLPFSFVVYIGIVIWEGDLNFLVTESAMAD